MAKNKMLRNYQRKFNGIIREANKSLEEDKLFLGRFYVRQMKREWYKFDDNSGGEIILYLRVVDKKTDYYKDYRIEYAPWLFGFSWRFYMGIINEFITEASGFWYEEPSPSLENATNFIGIKNDEIFDLHKHNWNFYVNKKI